MKRQQHVDALDDDIAGIRNPQSLSLDCSGGILTEKRLVRTNRDPFGAGLVTVP